MFSSVKHRASLWVLSILLLLNIAYIIYHVQKKLDTTGLMIAILFLGLILGVLIVTILYADKKANQPKIIKESSHTVMQSMQRVFKIVTSEGYFNEIYDYKDSSKIFKVFPTTKKALVIIKGKVQMGYDFAKCKWDIDESNKRVKLTEFPKPEILSIETDYQYYNIEEQFYNLFSKEDLANIQREGKNQIKEAAIQSHLPITAAEQIEIVLKELLNAKGWKLENSHLIENKIR